MGVLTGCQPRAEVLRGDLNDAIFAADFGDVIARNAPKVYGDPVIFFRNTHPAQQLKKIVQAVFGRLADPTEGGATIRLSTGFGGGKTHTLIALYHLAKNIGDPGLGTDLLAAAGRPDTVSVVAVDASKPGLPVFATHGQVQVRSLWGEIFYQLGGEAALRDLGAADDPEASPNDDQITAVLPDGPLLILLDELVIYLAKLSERGQGNLLGFLNNLAAIVAKRPQAVLIVTDPARQSIYEKQAAKLGQALMDAAIRLDDLFGRRISDFDPIGDEAAQMIVRRLFDRVNPKEAQRVSRDYYALYQRVASDIPAALPQKANTLDYARRFVDSYPFHPRLLDTAQDRLGALGDFQKSRGVLRLFARILRDVWERGEDVDVISAGDIDWASPRIQADLLQRLNRDRFRTAVDADVGRHAGELDGDNSRGINRRVASALLLESIPLQGSSGLDSAEATLAILRTDEAGNEPGDALDRLAGACWHIYPLAGGRGWQFRYEENVLKQIEERKAQYQEEAKDAVRAEAQQFFNGPQFKLRAWPASAQQVAPAADLQLALCESEDLAKRVCAYEDESDPSVPMPRGFRNAILAVAPNPTAMSLAVERGQRLRAAEAIKKEYEEGEGNKPGREQIQKILPDLRKQLRVQTYRAFDRLVLASGQVYRLEEPLQADDDQVLQKLQGQPVIQKFLVEKNLIYDPGDAVDPGIFLSKVLPGTTPTAKWPDAYTAKAVHERFLGAPGLRLIPSGNVVRKTLLRSLSQGKIVIRLADGDAYDAEGYVTGPAGSRKRSLGALSTSLKLDDATVITVVGSGVASEWLRVDAPPLPKSGDGDDEGDVIFPPKPATPGRVMVKIREDFGQYALERPLLELTFVAGEPALANQLAGLAQPLGADSLALDLTVSGDAKDGGSINFAVERVKLNLAIRPFQMAQTIFNSLSEGAAYQAQLKLMFGSKGRTGTLDALTRLADDAPEGISIVATFGAPDAVANA